MNGIVGVGLSDSGRVVLSGGGLMEQRECVVGGGKKRGRI